METVSVNESSAPVQNETAVSLGSLAELTGFPVEYIKRELFLSDEEDLSVEELRKKVLAYLSSNF